MAPSAPSPSRFRLMDLPSENRNRVFSYALPGQGHVYTRNVVNFRFPAITRVSHQVRQETLPLLFAESTFVFNVGTNATGEATTTADDTESPRTLGFDKHVQAFITDAGDSAIFRNVTLYVQRAAFTAYASYSVAHSRGGDSRPFTLHQLTILVKNGHVRNEVVEGGEHPRKMKRKPDASAALDDAVEAVITMSAGWSLEITSRASCRRT